MRSMHYTCAYGYNEPHDRYGVGSDPRTPYGVIAGKRVASIASKVAVRRLALIDSVHVPSTSVAPVVIPYIDLSIYLALLR